MKLVLLSIWIHYGCCNKCCKLVGLKHTFMILQFWGSELEDSFPGPHQGVCRAMLLLKVPGNSLLLCLFQLVELHSEHSLAQGPRSTFKACSVASCLSCHTVFFFCSAVRSLCSLLIRILFKSSISSPCVILVLLLSLEHITIWLHFTSLQWNRAVGFKTTNCLHIAKSNNHISILLLFDLQRALDTVIAPCCRLHICVYPICWNWMSNMIVLGCGDFGRFLGHEGGDIMDKISVLIKETPQSI